MPTTELQSVLSNDNAPFMKSMDRAENKAKETAKGVEQAFERVGEHIGEQFAELGGAFIGIAGVEGIKEWVKGSIEFGRGLQDASERLDLTVDAVQRLEFAFAKTGARQEDFEKGMVKLNQAIEKARDGDERMEEAFGSLGVKFTDLADDKPEEILFKMADGMKTAKDPTEALAAAMEILGKSAYKLVPGLKEGSEELKEFGKQAKVLTEDETQSLTRLGQAWDALTNKTKVYGAKALLALLGPSRWTKEMVMNNEHFSKQLDEDAAHEREGRTPEDHSLAAIGVSARPKEDSKEMQEALERGLKVAKEMTDEEERILALSSRQWSERAHAVKEIRDIESDIFDIETQTDRQGMTDDMMRTALTEDRSFWVKKQLEYENDIFGLHMKDAALAQKHVAQIDQKIHALSPPETAMQRAGITGNRDMADAMADGGRALKFGALGTFAGFGGGGLTSGGLSSGGLDAGGLNGGASHVVRRGDAALAKEAAKQEKDANKGVEGKLDIIAGLLQTSSAPTGQ